MPSQPPEPTEEHGDGWENVMPFALALLGGDPWGIPACPSCGKRHPRKRTPPLLRRVDNLYEHSSKACAHQRQRT